ncbi:cobalt/nickel transport system ATP-binding protein [Azospirillum fermentarium]|uniref:energy-coupling factor ABC transporter ATP-binding protein n=1 Tax=Azospirillum fermentarium TaxID=1233114 RepID=UPI002227063A|nr:ABC transporter ATP-binding protein [Azospirillum fermentarium]MCW2248878.1 cobalt/nickel transport system ATP-binding protein [Azospirillum fermentarium]
MNAPLFRLTGITFAYDRQAPVLERADFSLWPGETVALTGPNGAGKTTLFHLMAGLLRPSAGTIEAFGAVRRRERDFHAVRARAGLLFQDSDDQLFCPTVAEDVAFGPLNLGKSPEHARRIAENTLESLGLAGFGGRVTHTLSGGQKRLAALAAVLAMEPEVLLLDEPTNALDAETQERLTSILAGLPQAKVIISHDDAFLRRLATRRVRLERGRLAAEP